MSEEKVVADTTNTAESESKPDAAEMLYGNTDSTEEAKPIEEPEGESKEEEKSEESAEPDGDADAKDDEESDKESDDDSEKDADTKESKAPDKYDFEVDDDDPITDAQLGEIARYAKERGLPNEEAQKIVDMQSKAIKDHETSLQAKYEQMSDKWVDEIKSDPELGGDKFGETVQVAKDLVDRFGDEKLKEYLNGPSKMGNNPTFIKFCYNIGKVGQGDKLVFGDTGGSKKEKTVEQHLYPDSNN